MNCLEDHIHVYEGPPFLTSYEVESETYGEELVVRGEGPDFGPVDAAVCRWSPTHVLLKCTPDPVGAPVLAWVPAGWVERVPEEESSYRDPYRHFHFTRWMGVPETRRGRVAAHKVMARV
ncbi:hypothetical protein HDA30_000294 [Micrococcus cohnii]|uniref:Uncharacterized protein n=1 Tax=Micrococcus cohnii TaxID=993416 RepID=A0A7W7GME0_9MICC|nr:hypothetical protein [Micrococcus cohnii]MBB4734786.1 hypothetical protein [Micrococcus cohnii]